MTILYNKQFQELSMKNFKKKYFWLKIFCEDPNLHGRPSFVSCVIALTNCAIEACESLTHLCNIYYNFCTIYKHVLLIVHKIWHGISPEGYRQVLSKINQNYICQQGNILLDNLRVLDLARMSRSHVKGHRRGGVCVLRMLLVLRLVS